MVREDFLTNDTQIVESVYKHSTTRQAFYGQK